MSGRAEVFGYTGLAALVAALLLRLLVAGSATPALGLAVLGLGLFLVYFFLAGGRVQGFLGQRSTRAGGSVLTTTLFVAGIAVLVNVLGAQFRTRWDVTADRLFTLAPETVVALEQSPVPPEVWVFYPEGLPLVAQLRSILEAARHADPRLRFHIVDPGRDPFEALRFELQEFSTVVQVGERFETFQGGEEEDFLAALLRAYRPHRARIGFVYGHGEAPFASTEPEGLRMAADALDGRGYRVVGTEVIRPSSLRDTLDILVFAGPRTAPSEAETDSILAFMERGGRLLALLDPAHPISLDRVLGRVGIRFVAEFLTDPGGDEPRMIYPPDYSSHPAVLPLARRNIRVALPGAGSFATTTGSPDVRRAALLRTGPTIRRVGEEENPTESRNLAVAAEWSASGDRGGRLVAFADADFATNRFHRVLGNADLLLGAVQWLAQEEALIEITPRTRSSRPVVLTRQQGRALMVLLTGLLPLTVLAAGFVVWWKRR